MCEFDRLDICEAYAVIEWDYHMSGWLRERKSNQRRLMSTGAQLNRMGFKPAPSLEYDALTENGKEIYHELEQRYGFADWRYK